MVKLRKASAYRRLERPYTRRSKFKSKSYIRANPNIKVVRFDMGNLKKEFPVRVELVADEHINVRHNALESARQTSNRILDKEAGKINYHMKIRAYPHHILRENPLASGAGADRMSTGMKMSFGKAIGSAARVKKGQIIMEVRTDKKFIDIAKKAMTRAKNKMPCSCKILIREVEVAA